MKLSEIIKDYRSGLQISQRQFARQCSLSNSYISFIENENNPKTGKPIVPTIEQYKKLADGMSITVQQLFDLLDDDAPVSLEPSAPDTSDDIERRLLAAWRSADPEYQRFALEILESHPRKKESSASAI